MIDRRRPVKTRAETIAIFSVESRENVNWQWIIIYTNNSIRFITTRKTILATHNVFVPLYFIVYIERLTQKATALCDQISEHISSLIRVW